MRCDRPTLQLLNGESGQGLNPGRTFVQTRNVVESAAAGTEEGRPSVHGDCVQRVETVGAEGGAEEICPLQPLFSPVGERLVRVRL